MDKREAAPDHPAPPYFWDTLGPGPAIMGVLNVTPDSFSDGGDHLDWASAIEAGLQMAGNGAAIVDVGGESTRPGSAATSPQQEQDRILPVITALAREGVRVSVDTRHAATMAAALDAGATIVNDVSALTHDPAAASLVARRACPVILMHMRGTPDTMQSLARYADVTAEVRSELATRIERAKTAGVKTGTIAIDPGFGFAKTNAQNAELLRGLPHLATLGHPIVAGLSRKATIRALAGEPDPKRVLPGSLAAALLAMTRGATILRVHDVAATRQALAVWRGLCGEGRG